MGVIVKWQQQVAKFFENNSNVGRAIKTILEDNERASWQVSIDIIENDSELIMLAELPGMKEEEIALEMEDGLLVISGEKKPANFGYSDDYYYKLESNSGKFLRKFAIPLNIDIESVSANLKDGILTIKFMKK